MSTADSSESPRNDLPMEPREGLTQFYSSQTALILEQYNNINQLLGPTDDWTWPGTHCEALLRSFLRRNLPSFYGVDKGFIYGRRDAGVSTKHCPEIDILIHDNHHFRPILQIDDFVIVQAKAVAGIVQVKRTMDSTKLAKGLDNVIDAKSHFLRFCSPKSHLNVFSAVVFFDERMLSGGNIPSEDLEARYSPYARVIREKFLDPSSWDLAPDFLGSLRGVSLFRRGVNQNRLEYIGLPSSHGGENVSLQLMLWKASKPIVPIGCEMPFWFPDGRRSEYAIIAVDREGNCSITSVGNLGDSEQN